MKRVLKPINRYDDLVKVLRITVDVLYSYADDVAAAIQPLQNPDGSYDELAVAEYDAFIIEALEVFESHDFVILDEHESPRSKSAYYSLVKRDDADAYDYKFVLFVRLSDHANRAKSRSQKMHFYEDKAQQIKQPTSKRHQRWKLKEIIVNGQTFESYDDALDAIDIKLREYD